MGELRIAVLGAGATGVCASLELAARGYHVDLYDENVAAVTRASHNNEGKIHLGILYAKDTTLRTAHTMITGALHFSSCLNRWIDFDADSVGLSSPFHYVVHSDTMVGVDDLKRHYAGCRQIFDQVRGATRTNYLGVEKELLAEEITSSELDRLVNPEHFVTAFRTSERSIDPRSLASSLRDAVAANDRITFISNARVVNVKTSTNGQLEVSFEIDGATYREAYDQVANTLWHGRLQVDSGIGLSYDRPWLYRYKFGNRVFAALPADAPPSLTCVLGPFGDIVNFGDRGMYLSWYPIGMTATSQALRPPEWQRTLSDEARYEVFRRSHEHWLTLCPSLASVQFAPGDVDPAGGVIFTWGGTDIDDHGSELHDRHEIGIHTVGNYHSVDTGKFTMAPYFGLKTAERILGIS